jgi:cyclopropane fatty-acyl-phospholipid synthase-like methyltransferase
MNSSTASGPRPEKPRSPSCERNQGPILEVLKQHFPQAGQVLEIGSGTGQHAVHFAPAFPQAVWQTSDVEASLPGIRLWLEEADLPNLPPPLPLEVSGRWPEVRYDAVFTANTLHIMGWAQVQKLFAALPGVLTEDATLVVYGPFNYGGRFSSESNRQFDQWLKQRHSPLSGIRDFEAVDGLAKSVGLNLVADHEMPANNRTLVWRREV